MKNSKKIIGKKIKLLFGQKCWGPKNVRSKKFGKKYGLSKISEVNIFGGWKNETDCVRYRKVRALFGVCDIKIKLLLFIFAYNF